jgi:hypothetical protein
METPLEVVSLCVHGSRKKLDPNPNPYRDKHAVASAHVHVSEIYMQMVHRIYLFVEVVNNTMHEVESAVTEPPSQSCCHDLNDFGCGWERELIGDC